MNIFPTHPGGGGVSAEILGLRLNYYFFLGLKPYGSHQHPPAGGGYEIWEIGNLGAQPPLRLRFGLSAPPTRNPPGNTVRRSVRDFCVARIRGPI